MSKQLLDIKPKELQFIFELKKQSSCSVRLTNKTNNHIAFKVKTTSPKKYSVRPNVGVLKPKSTCEFIVIMQGQREAPADMICKDKFLIQSTIVPVGTTTEDITGSMFSKDDNKYVEENKLKVTLISPPQSPELSSLDGVLENDGVAGEDLIENDQKLFRVENLSAQPMVANNVNEHKTVNHSKKENKMVEEELEPEKHMEFPSQNQKAVDPWPGKDTGLETRNVDEPNTVKYVEIMEQRKDAELKIRDADQLKLIDDVPELKLKLNGLESKLNEAEITILKLTEERRLSNQEMKILREKLAELNRRGLRKVQVGFPLLYVCVVALICVVLGYHLHC